MWITATSLSTLVQFADLGIGYGFLNAATTAIANRDDQRLETEVSTAAVVLLVISGIAAAAFLIAGALISWPDVFRVVDPRGIGEAKDVVLIAVMAFLAAQALSIIPQFRFARQQGYVVHIATGVAAVASVAAVLLAIELDGGAPALTAAVAIPPVVATIVIAVGMGRGETRLPRPSLSAFSSSAAKSLLRSGLMFFSIQVAMSLAFAADPLIVTQIRGPTAAAEYGVVARLFLIPLGLVSAFLTPLWPAYRDAAAKGEAAWIRSVFRSSMFLSIGLGALVAAGFAVLGPTLVDLWINGSVTPQYALILGFAIWIPLSASGTAAAMLLNGLGEVRTQTLFALAMAVVNLAVSVWLTSLIGAAGAIWGTIISYVALVLIPMSIYVPRVLGRVQTAARSEES